MHLGAARQKGITCPSAVCGRTAGGAAEGAGASAPAGDPADAAAAPAAGDGAALAEAAGAASQAAADEEVQYVPGLLLRFGFGDATHDLSYEDIKAAFRPVAFVEFQKVGCCLARPSPQP